ncbi:MAG TPA: hypothetical protein VFA10_15295, partial [Ktedonobacteraceae bacterium]|nr:hypothetical protein [Ktedonobacteraceae bacterium]
PAGIIQPFDPVHAFSRKIALPVVGVDSGVPPFAALVLLILLSNAGPNNTAPSVTSTREKNRITPAISLQRI